MKVKVIEKPTEWPYVLVNDSKSLPYFAYEVTGENGIKSFVPVLKGDTDRSEPTHAVTPPRISRIKYLTNKRHALLTQFLKETLEKPTKYEFFRSNLWMDEFIKFMKIFDSVFELTPEIVHSWLEDSTFKGLIAEIEAKLKITDTMKKAQMKKKKEQRKKVKKGRVTRYQVKFSNKAASTSSSSSLSHRRPISSSSSHRHSISSSSSHRHPISSSSSHRHPISSASSHRHSISSSSSSLSHRRPISSSSSSLARNRISSSYKPPLSPSPPCSSLSRMSVASSDSDESLFIPITVKWSEYKKERKLQGMK